MEVELKVQTTAPAAGAPQELVTNRFINGWLIGLGLTGWGIQALYTHEKLFASPVTETLMVAFYLTMLVAYVGLKMPVFAHRSPFWSTFWLIMFSGHISLLFDSFAVVLLLATGIVFTEGAKENSSYNKFFVKVAATFAALTVGGGFYLGELWGLPFYITNGLANPLAGLPLLLVLTPACAVLAYVTARFHPVKVNPVELDHTQLRAASEFTAGLLLLILTHSPILCIGVLCLYTAVQRTTTRLVDQTAHEFKIGAQNALGLILLAVVFEKALWATYITPYLTGWGLFFGAAISSPFAGALAPPVDTLHDFYVGLSLLMCGAPLFVFSSLVAIMVFRNTLEYSDLPPYLQRVITLWGIRNSSLYVEEAVAYTLLVVPMVVLLASLLFVGNTTGLFVLVGEFIGVTMN